ncbi:MAG: hypothetical protein HY300_03100 [Verrucomicrobia bacterium]|nr:hypothetical protein [Verrucomicrobiota bacterium]
MRTAPKVLAVFAGVLAVTSAVRAGGGYLSIVGPTPVRFAEPAALVKMASLPPLMLADPKSHTEIALVTNTPPVVSATNEIVAAVTNIVVSVPISPVGSDPLTLQNFVRYFQIATGTNSPGGVVVPVPFSPPVPYGLPLQQSQSRAIYSVSP